MVRFLIPLAVCVAFLPLLAAQSRMAGRNSGPSPADRMEQKMARITEHHQRRQSGARGTQVTLLDEDEVNAWFQQRLGVRTPRGLSEIRLDLHPDRPSGTAMVDFEEVKASSKKAVNPLLDRLLTGKQQLAVSGRFTSSAGNGTFSLEQVSIGGLTFRGFLLDLLLRHFVLPRYPQVVLDRPFPLPAGIDQVVVEEGRARVIQR